MDSPAAGGCLGDCPRGLDVSAGEHGIAGNDQLVVFGPERLGLGGLIGG